MVKQAKILFRPKPFIMKTLIEKQKLWLSLLFAGFTFLAQNTIALGATVNSVASGNWNDDATWSGTAPGPGDIANIQPNHTVTVTANATISEVTINSDADYASSLVVNSGVKLTVSNRLYINSDDIEIAKINILGEVESQGDLEFNANVFYAFSKVDFGATGQLTLIGDLVGEGSGGLIDSRSGTIKYGSSSAQDVPELNYDYTNLIIDGGSTKTLTGNIVVTGNLTINSSNTFDVSASNYSINVGGNWINNGGTFNDRAGTITFDGSLAQAITSSGDNFYNVTFDNSGSGITLNDNMTIVNTCTLTDGVVSTGSNTLILEFTTASNLSGHSNASFVNGNLRRYIASNTSEYAFPVGNGTSTTNYFRADIVNNNMTGVTYIDANFEALSNHSDGDMSVSDSWIDFSSVHTAGMWTISPSSQPGGGSYNVRLYKENFSGLADNSFAPLKRPEGGSGANWTAPGTLSGDGGEGRMAAENYGLRLGLTSFSEFGMGTGTPTGLGLPIELTNFEGHKNGSKVDLNWVTATEINNDYFTIERSADGNNFETIAKVKGAGNSVDEINYTHIDNQPTIGLNYYRLKQTDFDGTFTYSQVVSVEFENQVNGNVNIYPNPVQSGNAINIVLPSNISDVAQVEIYSAGNGKKVFNHNIENSNKKIELPSSLSSGLYLVRVSSGTWHENQKLLIQ